LEPAIVIAWTLQPHERRLSPRSGYVRERASAAGHICDEETDGADDRRIPMSSDHPARLTMVERNGDAAHRVDTAAKEIRAAFDDHDADPRGFRDYALLNIAKRYEWADAKESRSDVSIFWEALDVLSGAERPELDQWGIRDAIMELTAALATAGLEGTRVGFADFRRVGIAQRQLHDGIARWRGEVA
jgi:hypothetical protein